MSENETPPRPTEPTEIFDEERGDEVTSGDARDAVDQADELRAARAEARDLQDRLARVSAELDNQRKRTQRERDQAVAFANEQLLLQIIPVIDSFERALGAEGDPQGVVRGVQLVKKQLEDAIGRFGATPFTTVGQAFDPARAEAVATRDDPSAPPGTVLDEHQRGWSLRGRLLRPARVVVASEPDTGGDEPVH